MRHHGAAHTIARIQRATKMNAAPDSHHPLFLGECGDSSELAREFRVDAVDNGDSARRIVPEDRREQRRNRSGLDGRLRWVFRIAWGLHLRATSRHRAR